MKDFIITQISWHTERQGIDVDLEYIIKRFRSFATFLQNNNLTTRVIIEPETEINDDSCIKASDLTDEGLEVVRKGYEKWLDALDRGKDPSDVTILEKALHKVRNKA